jgi:hypothetical protein
VHFKVETLGEMAIKFLIVETKIQKGDNFCVHSLKKKRKA